MGYVVVARHVFYLQAAEHLENGDPKRFGKRARTGEQTHLHVRAIRVPWGQRTARNAGYLDDSQFGGLDPSHKIGGQVVQNTKNFMLGKGYNHPKLIVADVTEHDLMTKDELGKVFFEHYKQKLNRVPARPRFSPDDLGEENWSREAGSISLKSAPYKVSFPGQPFNTVWMLPDPTWSGKRIASEREATALAKTVLDLPVQHELFQGMTGRRKQYNLEGITVLGVGYSLQYFQSGPGPVEGVVWIESIQRRVRPYLNRVLGGPKVADKDAGQDWYAIGAYPVPIPSDRFALTPRNRVRQVKTYRTGEGFYHAKPKEEFAYRPLFTVKGRNMEDARRRAQELIFRNIRSSDNARSIHWLEMEQKWHEAERKMVSKPMLMRLHQLSKGNK